MKRPIWFRLGRYRLGWTPCTWQGWAITGFFAAALLVVPVVWGASAPWRPVAAALVLVAALVTTAALTSEGARKGN